LDCTVDLKSIKKSVYKNVPAKQKAPEFRELFVRAIQNYFEPLIPACNNNAPKPPILFSCGLAACGFFACGRSV
jgi:hypothetical protein